MNAAFTAVYAVSYLRGGRGRTKGNVVCCDARIRSDHLESTIGPTEFTPRPNLEGRKVRIGRISSTNVSTTRFRPRMLSSKSPPNSSAHFSTCATT